MKILIKVLLIILVIVFAAVPYAEAAQKPNIVLVYMDNFGWGEIGTYGGGILRGARTPKLDTLAEEGRRQ